MRTLRSLAVGALITSAISFGTGLSGCANHEATHEGDYAAPPGFTLQQTKQATLNPGAFLRDDQQHIVSNTVFMRAASRKAQGLDQLVKSSDPRDDFHIETTFGDSYADGLTVATSRQPQAYLKVIPRNAQKAPGRVRSDGALIAFEGAYPNVTSAFGGRQSKVEEFLSIPSEADIPALAYDLVPGPEFGNFVEEEGTLWAFAKDGNGLFAIAPPVADDAAGKRVTGSWKLEDTHGKYVLTAQIELRGLQFPVLLDPSFEVPQWWITNSPSSPSARAGSAGAFDTAQKCTVLFGGATAAFGMLNDTYVRCSSDQKWSNAIAATNAPAARAYATAAHVGGAGKVALFGGYSATGGTLDELHTLTLSCSGTTASCTGSWAQVGKSGTWPPARYMHGAASDGTNLIIWGGIGASGSGLTDTWSWNGSTWTEVCSNCFLSPKGGYGFAPATTVTAGGARTIYSVGGYNDPSSATGQFTNTILRFTGSGWVAESANPTDVPVSEPGALATGGLTELPGRYLHWAAGNNNNNLVIGGGLTTSSGGVDSALFTDSWLWLSSPAQWLQIPHPVTLGGTVPGGRESATAVFDEQNRNVVLFGGLNGALALQNGRVYKGASHNVTVTQSCPDVDFDQACDNSDYVLTATIDDAPTTDCASYQVLFMKNGGFWEIGGTNIGTSTKTTANVSGKCTASFTYTALDTSTYTNLGVRVRDNRVYNQASGVCGKSNPGGNANPGEIANGEKFGCLPSGGTNFQGTAICSGLVDPSIPGLETLDCSSY